MAVTIAVGTYDSPTGTGNQDITNTNFGGGTPEVAILFQSGHIAANDPSDTASARIGVGAYDGTAIFGMGQMSIDNQAATDVRRTGTSSTNIVGMTTPAPATFLLGAPSALIANGVRVNWSTVQASAYRGMSLFMGGTDVEVDVGIINLGTGTSAITVTPGFAADVVFFFGNMGDTNGADFFNTVIGIATSDGTQKCIGWSETDAVAAGGQPSQVILSNKCACQQSISAGTQDYTVAASNFTATTFDVTPSANTNSDRLSYVALKFTGKEVKLWDFSTPTTTGQVSDTTPGFTPEFGFIVGTNLEALDAGQFDNDLAGGFGVSAFTTANQIAVAAYIQNADPSNTGSDVKTSTAMRVGNGTGSGGIIASLVSFDDTGWTLNYTAVQASAKKAFALAVGTEFIPPPPDLESGPATFETGEAEEADFEWPFDELKPRDIGIYPCASPIGGGVSLTNREPTIDSGNGYWRLVLGSIPVKTRANIKLWRALEANLEGRGRTIAVPFYDSKRAPWPGTPGGEIDAICFNGVLEGTTTIHIVPIDIGEIEVGMHFSAGHRLYRIVSMNAESSHLTCTIWPKTREPIGGGQPLEFRRPVCMMRLARDDGMALPLEGHKRSFPSVEFVEAL